MLELVDIVAPVLMFGAVFGGLAFLGWQSLRELFVSEDERRKTWDYISRSPLQALWNFVFCIGVMVFFGSLLLSSLGMPTWWK